MKKVKDYKLPQAISKVDIWYWTVNLEGKDYKQSVNALIFYAGADVVAEIGST